MQNIHPLIVHFPIALLLIGVGADLASHILWRNSLKHVGWWCQLLGFLALVAAVTTGLIAESAVVHNDAAHEIMETHEQLGFAVLGLFAILFIWRSLRRSHLPEALVQRLAYLILAIAATGVMAYGAHLGGRLVYEFGVGTRLGELAAEDAEHEHEENGAEKTEAQPGTLNLAGSSPETEPQGAEAATAPSEPSEKPRGQHTHHHEDEASHD